MTTKSVAQKATKAEVEQLVKAKKEAKVYVPRVLSARQLQRIMRDADASYEAWRKEGFKGAWWKRYFKNELGSDS